MAAISHRYRLVYFPIGKVATSSLKRVIFELDTGRKFKARTARRLGASVHHLYPFVLTERWLNFYPAYTSIVLVRDPIKRFLSGYSNRVLDRQSMKKNEQEAAALAGKNLSAVPQLDEFVENLHEFLRVSPQVRRHLFPQSRHVGKIWNKIQHRLPLEKIGEVPAILEEATGQLIEIPHAQQSGRKIAVSELSNAHFDKLVQFYKADYKMLREFYSPDQLR